MGSLYFDDILISEGVLDAERLLSSNEQVGGLARTHRVSATPIVTASNGELVFGGDELHFSVVLQRRTIRVADAVTRSWWQLEAKAEGSPFRSAHLFVSEHPWSSCYAVEASFKATRHNARTVAEDPATWPPQASLDDVIARTRNPEYDFWETSSRVYTATLDAPGEPMNVHRTKQSRDAWLTFGVSMEASAEQLEKKLLEDPVIKTLLAQTKKREISFTPSVALQNGATPDTRGKLHTAVKADAFGSIHTAIRQALAGVPGGKTSSLEQYTHKGEKVSGLVSLIYKQHLYDAHRRATYGDRKTESYEEER